MTCDECGKNKATVHLTEIINDQITKLNLCEICAKEKGSDVEQHFGIGDLLSALSDTHAPSQGVDAPAMKGRCHHCGLTYDDFKKIGRLGCSECYVAFKPSLVPLLKKIHGSNQHLGKSLNPQFLSDQKVSSKLHEELEMAKQNLLKAVKGEEFEEAASLRDKVKFLEKKIRENKA
ncbi:MAG: hypothetical protein A3C47_07255 [Omnitrophica bacterium RIFCSPHIGHO2_02_FULL_51_18]|nr:MAG: hypothetical protein A3C47_07255 [Omnitrophica bacterium RIFCSPHIGHO2_02_FULL_51_18]